MFEVEINGEKVNAEVSFYTAWLYEAEFRSELIKDLFGTQDANPAFEVDGDSIVRIDFTKVNWNAVIKVVWAAIKTADESTPPFDAWLKSTKGANLWLLNDVVATAVTDCFFRAEAAGEDD